MQDLEDILNIAKNWVIEIGQIQVNSLGSADLGIATKSSAIDLVTEVDRKSEAILINRIRENFPEHNILSEEAGLKDQSSRYCWVIDPLDGTTNYAQGLPIFAVSIALQYQNKTLLGLVYAPVLKQMFWAVKGQGAFLNGERLAVGPKSELLESVLATGFPYDRAVHPDNNVNYFSYLLTKVRAIRCMGSAAYDLANVAAGNLDGYWELNLSPWDVAAGALLVEEAGGRVIYLTEKRGVSLVAGNAAICTRLLNELDSAEGKGPFRRANAGGVCSFYNNRKSQSDDR